MIKINLANNEIETMMDFFSSEFLRLGDNNEFNTSYGKAMASIHDKIVRSLNKKGTWYLWQLIDNSKPVTKDNILPEWQ